MRSVIFIFLSILVLSCSSDDNQAKTTQIESTLIAKDNLYGNGAEGILEQNLVISNPAAWNDLIAQMNSVNNVSDNFSQTDIDFSQHTIIAIFDDLKAHGGHSLELNIISNSKNIIVQITHVVPGGNATTVMTQPFHIVKIPKSDLPIIFE